MATVTLTALWLHDATDLSSTITIAQGTASETYAPSVARRGYAGGRTKIVTTPIVLQDLAVTSPQCTRTEWEALQDRAGTLQLMRNPHGRSWWGVVTGLTGSEFSVRDLVLNVSFTFSRVTHTEIV